MTGQEPDADRLVEITKRAAEIASHAPERLQEAAFNRVFDQLSGSGSAGAQRAAAEKRPARPRRSMSKRGAAAAKSHDDANDPATVLINSLSRTDHPEIGNATRALDRALHLLRVAESQHGIDGMTAPQIAKVLTEKFRQPVTRQAIGQALDAAGRYVDRTPGSGRQAATFRLMAPGEAYLAAGGAAAQDEGRPATTSRARRTRRSRGRPEARESAKAPAARKAGPSPAKKRSRRGPKPLIEELIDEGFFSEPRAIGDIQERLRHKKGVQFKATDLSPALVRLLRQNKLDRERNESNQYEYSVPS